jgi:predicted nucleic acid-binding Zn ribbon protein
MNAANCTTDPRECTICRAVYVPRSNRQVTCSRACWKMRKNARRNPSRPRAANGEQVRECVVCRKQFLSSKRVVCSAKCKEAHSRELHRVRERPGPRDARGRLIVACVVCQKRFARLVGKKTCSAKCAAEQRREYMRDYQRRNRHAH